MGTKERREKEKNDMRSSILKAADEIISEEGIENLSVRKIASKIEYSPGIIYHYFKDKDDILNTILMDSYSKIVKSLVVAGISEKSSEEKLKESMRCYIELALSMSEEYKTIMMSTSESILQHTSILFRGVSHERKAIGILCDTLKEFYKEMEIDESFLELTAQIIWTSIFGLIIRLITEKNVDEAYKEKLIERHINFIISGLRNL